MYVEGLSATIVGARMKRMLSVGSSLSVINIHEHHFLRFSSLNDLCCEVIVVFQFVCRSLGYSGGSATTNSRFGNAPGGDFGMDDVKCQVTFIKKKIRIFFLQRILVWLSQGYEEKLTDCQYASYDDCDANEAAGVVCEDAGMLI